MVLDSAAMGGMTDRSERTEAVNLHLGPVPAPASPAPCEGENIPDPDTDPEEGETDE